MYMYSEAQVPLIFFIILVKLNNRNIGVHIDQVCS